MNRHIEPHEEAARQLAASAIRKGFEFQALHEYHDRDGKPIFWRIRLKHPETGEKWLRPMKLNGRGYILGEPEFPGGKPLYRLPKLNSQLNTEIYVVEGEICADALEKLGLLVTTSGGADSAGKADWSILAERSVVIWPDYDEAGQRYAETVAAILLRLGCTVHMIDVHALNLPSKGDVVDWLAIHGEATGDDLAGLPKIELQRPQQGHDGAQAAGGMSNFLTHGNPPQAEYVSTVQLVRGCDLKPEPVSWLWDGWLAAGKMHILGGAPGTGKTTISLSLAAIVTTGGRWPDGSQSPAGNVVIWSGEDDPADTMVPRLLLSGTDVSRVYFIDEVRDGNEPRPFDPARDIELLRRKLAEIGDVRLLIVDPIVSAVAGDSHKNAEVRRSLQPLADLAASTRCALLGITHFSKGTGGREPVERLTGSLAFGALARIVLVAAKHQEEGVDGRMTRLFLRAKSNIGPDDGGYEYDLQQGEACPGIFNSCVIWGNAVEGGARELLATAEAATNEGGGESVQSVASWLHDLLIEEGGRIDRRDVMKAAQAMGYNERTVHRARVKLNLVVQQSGFGKGKRSVWKMIDSPMSAAIVPIMPSKIAGTHGTNGGTYESVGTVEVKK
jgi:hypothetical protein